jgi:hypothetical protein
METDGRQKEHCDSEKDGYDDDDDSGVEVQLIRSCI